jgi:mitochondrial fission protein ELM1
MKTFYEAWVQQFTRNPDMKVEGQMQLVEVLNLLQDPTAETLQKSIVSQNKNKRTDLGITAGAEALFKEVEAKNWKEAEDQFKKLIRRFDDNGGGNLFYDVVRPYVKACMENDQKKQAKDGLKFSVKKIRMDEDSILAKEFKKLEKYVDDGEK